MAGCATVLFCPSEWSKVLEGDEEPKRGQKSGVKRARSGRLERATKSERNGTAEHSTIRQSGAEKTPNTQAEATQSSAAPAFSPKVERDDVSSSHLVHASRPASRRPRVLAMAILLPPALVALLSDLVSPRGDGAPHTALVCSPAHNGHAVVVAHSIPTQSPWPPISPTPEEADDDARASMYAALAGGAYDEHRTTSSSSDPDEPVLFESEHGRIAVTGLGAFLLVLVGTPVAPWKVLDKKIRAASDQLRGPLETVAA